jgi:hypothetical protein
LSDDPAASFSRISVVLARMGDAHDIAEIARRLAGLAPRQLVDLDPEVLGQEFADDHGLAEKLGAVAPAGVSPSPRARRQCRVLSGIELTCSTGGFGGVWWASHILWAAFRRRAPNERKRMASLATICLAPSNRPFICLSLSLPMSDVACE